MSHVVRKPVWAICEQKGADQPAHPWSLISAFVVRYLDSIIPILAKSKLSRTQASLCSWPGRIESYLIGNPEDRFSRVVAHLKQFIKNGRLCFQFTSVEAVLAALLDSFPRLRRRRILVTVLVCLCGFVAGLAFCCQVRTFFLFLLCMILVK